MPRRVNSPRRVSSIGRTVFRPRTVPAWWTTLLVNLSDGSQERVGGRRPSEGGPRDGTSARPVALSDPDVVADQRYPLLAVVALTGTAGEGALYPALEPGPSGLNKISYALIDQIRSVDKRRVRRTFGRITMDEMRAIDEGLALYLGLAESTRSSR